MQWFRWYHETSADPKFGSIARKLKVPKYLVLAVWQVVLESASANTRNRGRHDMDADGTADRIGAETDQAAAVLAAFIERGMVLPDGTVTAFVKRNRKSDDVNERVKRHRNVTPEPEAVTETPLKQPHREKKRSVEVDIDSEANASAAPVGAAKPMSVFDAGQAWLCAVGGMKPEAARTFVGKLCRGGNDAVVAAALDELRARDPPPNDPKSALVFAVENRKKPNGQHRPNRHPDADFGDRLRTFAAGGVGGSPPDAGWPDE